MEDSNDVELTDDTLINRCLFGDAFDKKRVEACRALMSRCHLELKNASPTKRSEIKEQIIDDVSFVNEEDTFGEKRAIESGEEFYEVYSRPNLFDGDFDEEEFLNNRNKGKFRTCHMALYGLEKQFWSQINESMFQSKENADALKDIEAVILADAVIYDEPVLSDIEIASGWTKLIKDSNFNDIMTEILFQKRKKPKDVISYSKDLLDYTKVNSQYKAIKDYLSDSGLSKASYTVPTIKELDMSEYKKKWKICNDITNPKVEQDKYRICSEAGSDNRQSFSIEMSAEKQSNKLKKDLEVLDNRFKKLYSKFQSLHTRDKHFNNVFRELTSLRSKRDNLKGEIDSLRLEEWINVSQLDCWHNFLAMVEYPQAIKDRWLEILLAFENGDITKEQYQKAVDELKHMEEMFQVDMREGSARHGFTKPTTYQPIRMRLYGSQKSVNDLINKFLRFEPLNTQTVPNATILSTIKRAFTPVDRIQLERNEILDENIYIKDLQRLERATYSSIMKDLYSTMRESQVDFIVGNWEEMIGANNLEWNYNREDFALITKILFDAQDFLTWEDDIQLFFRYGQHPTETELRLETRKAIMVSKDFFEWEVEEEIENLVNDYFPTFRKLFPTIDSDTIYRRMKEIAVEVKKSTWNWEGRQDFIAYIPYDNFYVKITNGIYRLIGEIEEAINDFTFGTTKSPRVSNFKDVLDVVDAANNILKSNKLNPKFDKDVIIKRLSFPEYDT